jgi:hypothetical protein
MRHHLGSKIDVEALNEQKRRFHYFKLHDLNHDGALDGLEIIKVSFLFKHFITVKYSRLEKQFKIELV